MSLSQASIAVVLLNWNGWRDTADCVESLLRQDRDIGVIICDNASTDGSTDHLRQWAQTTLPLLNQARVAEGRIPYSYVEADAPPRDMPLPAKATVDDDGIGTITFIQTGANLGFAGGNNVGLRYGLARNYEYFWILNNDTRPQPDALTEVYSRMAEDPTIGMGGSTLVYMDRPDMVQCLGGGVFSRLTGRGAQTGTGLLLSDVVDDPAIEKTLTFISGAAMLVSRQFLLNIGLMYEGYFLYYEEVNWAMRALGKYKLGYAPKSVVLHKVGSSIGTSDFELRSPVSEYFMNRNRVRFLMTYSKISLPFTVLDVIKYALSEGFKGRWRRAWLIVASTLQLPYSVAARPGRV